MNPRINPGVGGVYDGGTTVPIDGGGDGSTVAVSQHRIKDSFRGTATQTRQLASAMDGFGIANDGGDEISFSIGGLTVPVKGGEVFEGFFEPFTIVTITTTTPTPYRAYLLELIGNLAVAQPQDLVPPPPANVTATAGEFIVNLEWNAVSFVDGYNVYNNQTGEKLNPTLITSPFYTATGLTNGTNYSYAVTSVRVGKESNKSAVVTATPRDMTPPPIPSAPNPTASNGTVALTWPPVIAADLAGYHVWRSGTRITTNPITQTSYNDTGLTNGIVYVYTIASVDTAGNISAQSLSVNATPVPDTTAPPIPNAPSATPGNAQVTLNWAAVTGVTDLAGYNVYRDNVKINTLLVVGTTYTATGLTNGTSYAFTITAVDTSNNESAKSPATTSVPAIPPIGAPTNLTATPGDKTVVLNWNAPTIPAGATLLGYRIYRNTVLIATPGLVTTYTDNDSSLTNGTQYSYTISSVDSTGAESAQSSPPTNATPSAQITWQIDDTFTRADTSSGLGVASSGQVWNASTLRILSNQAAPVGASGTNLAVGWVELGSADGTIEAVIATADEITGLLKFRVNSADSTHVSVTAISNELRVYEVTQATGNTQIGSSITYKIANGDRIRATFSGSTIKVYVNGTKMGPDFTTSFNLTQTKVGFGSFSSGAVRWDNFKASTTVASGG